MSINEFIKCADGLSHEIITEVSMEDVAMLKGIMKDYSDHEILLGTLLNNNAKDFEMALRMRRKPGYAMEHILTLNALILLLFVTDNMRLKKEMMDYLRSLKNPSVDTVLNKYFPTTRNDDF
ncbi:hypothetical protein EDD21DRAFT_351126 [Dissophora ornata]|nr:hypothetical protein EDD21DRAFT_351126 [Dissophora ornata]